MTSRRSSLALLGLAYLAFTSLGLPDGLIGVAWPKIRTDFALGQSALGGLLLAGTAGYVTASALAGWILTRIGVGALLALSCAATAAALLGYTQSPGYAGLVVSGVLLGLGAGAIDAGLNGWVALQHSARKVSLLHAFYGLGAAGGPLIMAAVLSADAGWRSGYWIVAAVQVALAAAFACTRSRWRASPVALPASPREALRIPAVRVAAAAFFVYTGLEAAAGTWSYSLLAEGRGVAMHSAAFAVTCFWSGLMLGRLGVAFSPSFASPEAILRGALCGVVLAAGIVWWAPLPGADLAGLALLGLACGPVFPTLIALTPKRVGASHAESAIGLQVAAAALGQALLPAALGVAIGGFGLGVVAPGLVAAALALAAVYATLERISPARASLPAPAAPSRALDAAARADSPR